MTLTQLEVINNELQQRIAINNKKLFKLRRAATAKANRDKCISVATAYKKQANRTFWNILEAPGQCSNSFFIINRDRIVYPQLISINNIKEHSDYIRELISNVLNIKFDKNSGKIMLNYGVARGDTKQFIDDHLIKYNSSPASSCIEFIIRHRFKPSFDLKNSILGGLIEHVGVNMSYNYFSNSRVFTTENIDKFIVYEKF